MAHSGEDKPNCLEFPRQAAILERHHFARASFKISIVQQVPEIFMQTCSVQQPQKQIAEAGPDQVQFRVGGVIDLILQCHEPTLRCHTLYLTAAPQGACHPCSRHLHGHLHA